MVERFLDISNSIKQNLGPNSHNDQLQFVKRRCFKRTFCDKLRFKMAVVIFKIMSRSNCSYGMKVGKDSYLAY